MSSEASASCRSPPALAGEDHAQAGDAPLGLLQLGDVERLDREAAAGEEVAGAGETGRKEHAISERERVRSPGLGVREGDDLVSGEDRGVEPLGVGEEEAAAFGIAGEGD